VRVHPPPLKDFRVVQENNIAEIENQFTVEFVPPILSSSYSQNGRLFLDIPLYWNSNPVFETSIQELLYSKSLTQVKIGCILDVNLHEAATTPYCVLRVPPYPKKNQQNHFASIEILNFAELQPTKFYSFSFVGLKNPP
jgi:hypothetical protein